MHKYINVNGQYGFGQDRSMDYSSIEEILEGLDLLGIWQTIVEFPMASNAIYQAQRLLGDLERIPQWRQRIIPTFAVGVSTLFQKDGIAQLRQILQAQQPFCLSLYPKNNSYRLRMADRVLDELQDLCSVVLIDRAQLMGEYATDDLVYLAQRYPKMHFIVRRFGNSSLAFIFDVMARAENICADTSSLHTRKTIETICGLYGEHRVVFGTVPKIYAGASMAAITFADVSEETKDKIRYGNFISMFQDEPSRTFLTENLKAVPDRVRNRFWRPFVEEGIAPDVDIYDVHCHMGHTDWKVTENNTESLIPGLTKDMDTLNVKKLISAVSGGIDSIVDNRRVEQTVGEKKDRFLGYVHYNPNYDWRYTEEYLDDCFRGGYFVGLKTLPSYMHTDIRDPRYDRMFRYAHEHNLPILIHTWGGSDSGSPTKCVEAAAKWPNAKIIIGHTGGSKKGRQECEAIAQDPRWHNVYFEFCGSWGGGLWNETLTKIDPGRVLYGSDSGIHNMMWEMGRLLSHDVSDEVLTAILGANAKKLFGF